MDPVAQARERRRVEAVAVAVACLRLGDWQTARFTLIDAQAGDMMRYQIDQMAGSRKLLLTEASDLRCLLRSNIFQRMVWSIGGFPFAKPEDFDED